MVLNILVLNVIKGLGVLASEGIDLVENISLDLEPGLRGGALDGLAHGLDRVGDDTAKGIFDLTKEAVFNGMPFGGIGRIVRDAQPQPQALTEVE